MILLATLALAGCSGSKDKAAMVVNDVAVPQGVLNYYINYGKDYLTSYGINIEDPETGGQYLSLIEEQGVDIVKGNRCGTLFGQRGRLNRRRNGTDRKFAGWKNYFADDAAWQEWLTTYQLTENDVKWILEYQLLSEALYEHVNKDITMTDAEVEAIYNANPADYDTFKFAHILISPEGTDDAAWAAAQQTANDVLTQINNGEKTLRI